jgi:hypothetical protein
VGSKPDLGPLHLVLPDDACEPLTRDRSRLKIVSGQYVYFESCDKDAGRQCRGMRVVIEAATSGVCASWLSYQDPPGIVLGLCVQRRPDEPPASRPCSSLLAAWSASKATGIAD